MKKFKVTVSSKPGLYAQYSGEVEVWAEDEEQAAEVAFVKLKRTSFPDRNASMWNVDDVQLVYE